MDFVAFIGNDKENWGQITALVNKGEWDNVIIVKSRNAEGFPALSNGEVVDVDCKTSLIELKEEMLNKLKVRIKDFEVSLSLASGNGKEHMALISALLSIPVGIRLVVFTKKGIEQIN